MDQGIVQNSTVDAAQVGRAIQRLDGLVKLFDEQLRPRLAWLEWIEHRCILNDA